MLYRTIQSASSKSKCAFLRPRFHDSDTLKHGCFSLIIQLYCIITSTTSPSAVRSEDVRRRLLSLLAAVSPPRHTNQDSGGPGGEQSGRCGQLMKGSGSSLVSSLRLALAAPEPADEASDPIHKEQLEE